MKKYTDILKEITKTRNTMTDTAKTEKELEYLAMKEAHKNGNENDFATAKSKYKEAEKRYVEELQKNENLKLKIEILKNNAAQAFFAENIHTICEIWNKYEGKPHGEKTAEKIRDELKTATGYYISIRNKYDTANIYVYFNNENPAPFQTLEFYPIWDGNNTPATIDNKIQHLTPEKLKVYNCGEYVENVNAHINALRKAHAAAKEAEKAFSDAVSKYNELTRGNIQNASTREGVKNWLI